MSKTFMVAVDGSMPSDVALSIALQFMNKKDDSLLLIHVVPAVYTLLYEVQARLRREGRRILHVYIQRAKDAGVAHVSATLGVAPHEGEFLVRMAKSRKVNFLVLGRRDLGRFWRFFEGSTSKYVLEHADCDVIIAKRPSESPKPAVAPSADVKDAKANDKGLEVENMWQEVHKEHERSKDYIGPLPAESSAPAEASKEAEEEERTRRIKEEELIMAQEKEQRTAAHIGTVIAEEEERKRRVKEDGIRDVRSFKVQIYDLDT